MNDLPPPTHGEQEPIPVQFGDIVRLNPIIRPVTKDRVYLLLGQTGSNIEVMLLPDEKHDNYSKSGTADAKDVIEVVGHLDFDNVITHIKNAWENAISRETLEGIYSRYRPTA